MVAIKCGAPSHRKEGREKERCATDTNRSGRGASRKEKTERPGGLIITTYILRVCLCMYICVCALFMSHT